MTYPQPYYDAWDAMTQKPAYQGLAPIHHGCFENGWKAGLEAAAGLAERAGKHVVAREVRELAVYTPDPEDTQMTNERTIQ